MDQIHNARDNFQTNASSGVGMTELNLWLLLIFSCVIFPENVAAQEPTDAFTAEKTEKLPPFKLLRAEEDYTFLHEEEGHDESFQTAIKAIEIGSDSDIYLSLGGEIRARTEFFEHDDFSEDGDQTFWSQRVALHASLSVHDNFRVFGEVFHGLTSGEDRFAEDDDLALHQGFAEYHWSGMGDASYRLRAGRQELAFGSARLFGIREGPNIRRSFDAVKATYQQTNLSVDVFYGREVLAGTGVFDNSSNLFEAEAKNPETWGFYSRFRTGFLLGRSEVYYVGFATEDSLFNDISGAETRHSIGLRRFGRTGNRFEYNTELIYQFGELGTANISAFNAEADWSYTVGKFKPGVQLEWSSGDNNSGDDTVNSYNPLFVNPEIYGISTIITPVNVSSIRPFLEYTPTEKMNIYIEYGRFWRSSLEDGFYSVPRFLVRPGNTVQSRKLGDQIGFRIQYEFNRNWSFDLKSSFFFAGEFLAESGENEDVIHIAPSLRFRF